MSTEEILTKIADLEAQISVLSAERHQLRTRGLELNAKRDALKNELDLAGLRERYPNLTIEAK